MIPKLKGVFGLPMQRFALASPFVFLLLMTSFTDIVGGLDPREDIPHDVIGHWAKMIGQHIFHILDTVANYNEIEKNFRDLGATVMDNDGLSLVKQMAEDVSNMMRYKIQAVKRIMNVAEEVSQDPSFLFDEWKGYYNAKMVNQLAEEIENIEDRYGSKITKYYGTHYKDFTTLDMEPNSHFDDIPITLNVSTVNVPTNVFEGAAAVIKAIRWSEALDKTFHSNYKHDPTLSWQYFGSSTGFLRQFPGISWQMDASDPDLYDARLRSWYIQAANSPKDVVILLDVSGSMTGLRKEIAKHVVINILDTLNENDYVSVYVFSEDTRELVPCFNNTLVQANLENIGEYKAALEDLETANISNFEKALTTAFEILKESNKEYNSNGYGSLCNQAIMLVTDGSPYTYEEIFKTYNWPQLQTRVFTYLIGREVTETRTLSWMACANKGYFVRVTTPSEVREQVLKYIPVVARPMVMYQNKHPIVWTGVYADIAGRRDSIGVKHGYALMTTVSVPVYNRTKVQERVSDLLGVAGTDVPIKQIHKLVPPYKLGVNGYSFMVNKNGYILYHPDFRPTFQDILKPNYNSVDLAEVELVDVSDDPRYNHSDLNTFRRDMIEQRSSETTFKVRIHLDDLKRVEVRNQRYFSTKVSHTPFSLGIAYPEAYGRYKVHGEIELSLAMKDDINFDPADLFKAGDWSLHPEWVYCEYKYDNEFSSTPEELMLHFLKKAQMPGWKWRSTRTRPPPDSTQTKNHQSHHDERDYYCDKTLVQSLLFDARATDVFNNSKKINFTDVPKNAGKNKDFGITSAFVSTRSGLTRWVDINEDFKGTSENPHFLKIHNLGIDEVWYKRAVDYYLEDPQAYVYSVPFDAAARDPAEVLVTATRAIFIHQNHVHKSPAAVVGVNMKLDKFIEFFTNETFKCTTYAKSQGHCDKDMTCRSETLDCYLLDDSGFILASEKTQQTGKFFGEIEGTIMNSMVQSNMYSKIKIYDYQAVCLDSTNDGSPASILDTPIKTMKSVTNWIVGSVMWALVKTQLYHLWDPNQAWVYANQGQTMSGNVDDGYMYHDTKIDVEDSRQAENEDLVYKVVENDILQLEKNKGIDTPDQENGEDVNEEYIVDFNELSPEDQNITDYEYDQENGSIYDMGTEEDYSSMADEGDEYPSVKMAYINKTRPRPCDKETHLYKLNNKKFNRSDPVKGKLSNCHTNGCSRPFSIQKIFNSNMVLVVVNNACPCEASPVGVEPKEVPYTEEEHCERLLMQHFRQRPEECAKYHPDEVTIKACGGCGAIKLSSVLAWMTIMVLLFHTNLLRT